MKYLRLEAEKIPRKILSKILQENTGADYLQAPCLIAELPTGI